MSEPITPATAPIAPQNPTKEPQTGQSVQESGTESKETPKGDSKAVVTEAKADAAADKVDAEKVGENYEIKVDGKVLTLSKEEMIKYAQLGHAGQKRMQEAAEREKKAEAREKEISDKWKHLEKMLKENPDAILEDEAIGHDKIELAKKWLAEKMERDAKSPEQIELEQLRAEKAALKKEKEEALKKQQEEAEARETEASMKAMEAEMLGAFKKYQLPNSPAMVDRMVGILEVARNNDLPVSIDDVAKIVRDDIKKDIQELAGMLPDDQFEELLGEIGINKIKQSTLKKMKSAPKVEAVETVKTEKLPETPKKKISVKDFAKPDHLIKK